MVVYELSHLFFRTDNEPVYAPKGLGLFGSMEDAEQAIQYYRTKPGFCETQDAFSIRRRGVRGNIVGSTVFEALVYLHSIDYEFEVSIELGLYGEKTAAESEVDRYCADNAVLVNARGIITEKIINRCIVERREWADGFSVSVF